MMSKTRRAFSLSLAACLTMGVLAAKGHPNFSGEWKIDLAQSDFGAMAAPSKFVRRVEHVDPQLTLVTTQASPQGELTTSTSYTTDGKENTNNVRGMTAKSNLKWDGDTLVISSRIDTPNGPLTQLERWELAADGKTLTVKNHLETPQASANLKLVLIKQ